MVEREKKRIRLEKKYATKRKTLLVNYQSEQDFAKKLELHSKIQKLPRNSSKTRIRNRCELSGRGRGVLRKFKLSRIWFRKLASECKLPGVTKASW